MIRDKYITIRANREELSRLGALAARCGKTKSRLIRDLLMNLETEINPQLNNQPVEKNKSMKESVAA